MSKEKLRKSAKVSSEEFKDQIGVCVDFSDSHGLIYGLVFPNLHGHSGRKDELKIHWFEPEEIEFEFKVEEL